MSLGALCEKLWRRAGIIERGRKGRGFIFVGHCGGGIGVEWRELEDLKVQVEVDFKKEKFLEWGQF